MGLPNYNLNIPARILFVLLPLAAMIAMVLREEGLEHASAVSRWGLDYVAFFLTALILFLSVAASESWARFLSKDKTNVAQTRKASFVGAGFCVLLIASVVVLHR